MDMKTRQSTLGSLLRALRLRNGWTLKEMSQRTSIPVSTLSKVEHDNLTLTYDKLVQLSQKLNIRMSELFADASDTAEPAVTARRSIGHLNDAVRVNTKNYASKYTPKSMIPWCSSLASRSIWTATWGTPMSQPMAVRRRRCSASARAMMKD
jgi:transcriptional regulator with XRE-family HTH domain